MEIYRHIQKHSDELTPQLEAFATLKAIVEIVHSCPKGFTSYCAISNTVKAVGIGGSASLFVTVKMSSFLADSQEAEARNLVALTRSKGLCLLLFPTRTRILLARSIPYELYVLSVMACFTLVRTGSTLTPSLPFSLNQTPSSLPMMASLLTHAPLSPRESWLFTHQITSYGAWTFLPFALRLTMHSARFELTLALRQEVPKPSCFQVTPDLFHWQATSWMAFGSHLALALTALSWPPILSSTCVFLTRTWLRTTT